VHASAAVVDKTIADDLSGDMFTILINVTWMKKNQNLLLFHNFCRNKGSSELYCLFIAANRTDTIVSWGILEYCSVICKQVVVKSCSGSSLIWNTGSQIQYNSSHGVCVVYSHSMYTQSHCGLMWSLELAAASIDRLNVISKLTFIGYHSNRSHVAVFRACSSFLYLTYGALTDA